MNEQPEALCLICGEPATTYLGRTKVLPLCPLASCETALINEINLTLDEAARDNEGAQV